MKLLKSILRVFLLFEIQFRIILVFLFSKGLNEIIDFLLHFQGYSYVTQNNYANFLKQPTVLIGLFLAAVVLMLLVLYECYGLFLLFDAGNRNQKVTLPQIYQLAGRYTASFIRKYPIRWIFFMFLCFPNLYLHLLIWEVERARFIDIVAANICERIGIPLFAAILVLLLIVSIIYSLTLPYKLFGKEIPFSTGFHAFVEKRKRQIKAVTSSVFLHLRVFLGTAVLYLLLVVLCVFLIRSFRPVTRYVSDTLFYASILRILIGLVIGFFGTVTITGYQYLVFRNTEESCISWEQAKPAVRPVLTKTLVLLAAGAILVYEGITYIPDTTASQDYLEITAHRGGAKFAPENTLAAIQYSIDTKSDYAEIDVQETADGEIILLHDNWLARTTGLKQAVWNTTYEEIRDLDAGSFFSSRFAGERIPTLREAITACRGKLRLNIEIKSNGHNPGIAEKVLAIVQEENFLPNCVITSMDYSLLKQIKELCPEAVTGYTLSMVYGRVEDMEAADFYSVKYTFVNRRLVERIHEMGKLICAWTTNTRASIRKTIDAGVDNVITDNPELVRKELLGEYDVIPSFRSMIRYMILP
ncbi:MAG: glycerophosphodiester phosphodiesterase family protein [Lachnospiraceae bacterium]|nr:glycerophosphodiester phosphodiesterase family protein [Lachnospiraceae bacterium]